MLSTSTYFFVRLQFHAMPHYQSCSAMLYLFMMASSLVASLVFQKVICSDTWLHLVFGATYHGLRYRQFKPFNAHDGIRFVPLAAATWSSTLRHIACIPLPCLQCDSPASSSSSVLPVVPVLLLPEASDNLRVHVHHDPP